MENYSDVLTPPTKAHHLYGLHVHFFGEQLFLPTEELGSTQFVEARVTDFIIDTIEAQWRFSVECIEDGPDNPVEDRKSIWIKISPLGSTASERAKLEARIGYTADPKSSMGYRNQHTSITPFDPKAVQISYFEPGMSQPLTDFGFTQTYSGSNLFSVCRGTYTIRLHFPAGYYMPCEEALVDEPHKITIFPTSHLIGSSPERTIPSIYALVSYRERPLGKIEHRRFPVMGGQFPHVVLETTSGSYESILHKDVIRYETHQQEEVEISWAEIHRHERPITARFLQISYEVIESLIDQLTSTEGDSDSLKAVLYYPDGQTVRCCMQLKVWIP